MSKAANDVVISGIGIVTCQGVGKDAHLAILTADAAPATVIETEKFKPYPVHPLPGDRLVAADRQARRPAPDGKLAADRRFCSGSGAR